MNIVVVTPSWPQHANPNGIATYYTNLIPALLKLGHNVHIITILSADKSENVHVRDYKLSFFEKIWCKFKEFIDPGYRQYFIGVKSICDKLEIINAKTPIDIVQMEDSFGWHYKVQQQFTFPVVMRLHGPYFLNSFEESVSQVTKNRIQREKRAFLAANYVTSPSKNVLDITKEKYQCSWLMSDVIANSMNTFTTDDRWQWSSVVKDQILFVGRFDNHKGADVLLHAFFRVRKAMPKANLVFIGPDKGLEEDNERINVKQFLKKYGYSLGEGGDQCVKFLGQQDKSTIDSLRRTSHITIVASRYETFGNVALEAIACGSPLVCSDSGALPEIIEYNKSGLLFENENYDDLAAKVILLLESPELVKKISNGGLKRVESVYSPYNSGKAIINFFEEVIALHHR